MKHVNWLAPSAGSLLTVDGREVAHWRFETDADPALWSEWARHFRAQYIDDGIIDALKDGTEHANSRSDYVRAMVFPDEFEKPGPSIRSGDFCEVLVCDVLEVKFGYVVPRTRFNNKAVRNESPKGSDVIGLKLKFGHETPTPDDELAIYEVKGSMSGKTAAGKSRLQDAIDDSCKDYKRLGESLNAMKRRLLESGKTSEVLLVQRFQNAQDIPYKYQPGAVAVLSSESWHPDHLKVTSCSAHPDAATLKLVVIEGDNLSLIAKDLYRIAADEA